MTATVHDLLAELGHAHDFAGVWAGRSFDSTGTLPQRARPPPRCTRATPPNLALSDPPAQQRRSITKC